MHICLDKFETSSNAINKILEKLPIFEITYSVEISKMILNFGLSN